MSRRAWLFYAAFFSIHLSFLVGRSRSVKHTHIIVIYTGDDSLLPHEHLLAIAVFYPQSTLQRVYSTRCILSSQVELKMPMNEHQFLSVLFHCRQSVTICLFNCRYDCIPRYVSSSHFFYFSISIENPFIKNGFINFLFLFDFSTTIVLQNRLATKYRAIMPCHRSRRASSTMK